MSKTTSFSKNLIIRENVPLAPFTTMQIGGPAKHFTSVRTEREALQAIRLARKNSWRVFVLGGGSNVVISDDGFPGLVIHNKISGFQSRQTRNKIRVRVGAGEIWDSFVKRAVKTGWSGIENLSGVPGTVGATPVQNVGCYGQSVENVITKVKAIEISSGKIKTFSRQECAFGYRDSVFRSSRSGQYFITAVEFELGLMTQAMIASYPDIEQYFRGKKPPTLQKMRRAILKIRARKGMLIASRHGNYKSVGSFFKNPLVTSASFKRIKAAAESLEKKDSSNWFWKQKDGTFKIAAARLIELAGFPKGYRKGKVGISPKHSLAIINLGKARGQDVINFAEKIKSAVWKKFRARLEYEAQIIKEETF